MARKVLIITVGGSCEPIVTTIQNHQPDLVYFICSKEDKDSNQKGSRETVDGHGLVCGGGYSKPHDKESIIKQTNLLQYEVIEVLEIDNLDECFNVCLNLIKQINKENKDSVIISDYTAGTKSMSAGLVLASTHFDNVNVSVVKGIRNNLQKTLNNTQFAISVKFDSISFEKKVEDLKNLISNFDYSSSCVVLQNILQKNINIDNSTKNKLQKCFNMCKAFDNWDKFNHLEAYELINLYRKDFLSFNFFLESLISERKVIDSKLEINDTFKTKSHHFELVYDLILNSERRAKQKKFDDGVARLYRALELFIQIHLKKNYQIETHDIDLDKIPADLKNQYDTKKDGKDKIKIGLMEAYELASSIKDDIVGKSFAIHKNKILNNLEARNQSILAHGFTPVSELKYNEVYDTFTSFIKENIEKLKNKKTQNIEIIQFPNDIKQLLDI